MKKLFLVIFLLISFVIFGCEDDEMQLSGDDVNLQRYSLVYQRGTNPVTVIPAYQSSIVSQQDVQYIPDYTGPWYFCGQAALATSLNFLRYGWESSGLQLIHTPPYYGQYYRIEQLETIDELHASHCGAWYSDPISNPNRETTLDCINATINNSGLNSNFIADKQIDTNRSDQRDLMLFSLNGNYMLIPLTRIYLSGQWWDHMVVIYKIDYQPGTPTGGTVYYADPNPANTYTYGFKTMGFAEFMDNMRDAGVANRYSFLRIKRQ